MPRNQFLLAIVISSASVTCYVPLRLYPIEGPLASRYPVPIIKGRLSTIATGGVKVQLPNGETCSGPWVPVSRDNEIPASEKEWAIRWDAVFGPGYFKSHVLGSARRSRAMLRSATGIQVTMEFYNENSHEAPILGVASDAQGNLFKVTL